MARRRVPVSVIVLIMGLCLLASCVAWAVAVQVLVPDICAYPSATAERAGPVRCEK